VIDAGETSGNTMSNYAGLLFALGRREAYATVEQAIKSGALDSPANRVEIPFYEYANGRAEGREAAINVLHSRIVAGDRSPGWNLDANIARAQQQNHPEAEWLPKLAAVVTDRAEPSSLVNWPLWRDLEQLPPKQA